MNQQQSNKLSQWLKVYDPKLRAYVKTSRVKVHSRSNEISCDDVLSYLYEQLCTSKKAIELLDKPDELFEWSKRIVHISWRSKRSGLWNELFDDPSNMLMSDMSLLDSVEDIEEFEIYDNKPKYEEMKTAFVLSLPPWLQVLWEYRVERGYSVEEIAEIKGTSPSYLRTMLMYIYRALDEFNKANNVNKDSSDLKKYLKALNTRKSKKKKETK